VTGINRTVDNHGRARARRQIRRMIVADLRPHVDQLGDIREDALIRGCPVLPPGARLVVLLGRAKMDTRQVIRRAMADPDLGWQLADSITFVGYSPELAG